MNKTDYKVNLWTAAEFACQSKLWFKAINGGMRKLVTV